jgi:hypothetical protein
MEHAQKVELIRSYAKRASLPWSQSTLGRSLPYRSRSETSNRQLAPRWLGRWVLGVACGVLCWFAADDQQGHQHCNHIGMAFALFSVGLFVLGFARVARALVMVP